MFKTFFLFTSRNMFRQKKITFINITGLAIGLAASFIMMLYVYHEYSYDNQHQKLEQIFRVNNYYTDHDVATPNTPYQLAQVVKETIPEVDKVVRVYSRLSTVVKKGTEEITTQNTICTDDDFFEIFTFPLVLGTTKNIFSNINNTAISNNLALKIFGTVNCIDKTIDAKVSGEEKQFKIAAVYKDIPETSTLQAEIILPIKLCEKIINKQWAFAGDNAIAQWRTTLFNTYILVHEGANIESIESKLPDFKTYSKEDKVSNYRYFLQPAADIYLHSADLVNNKYATGNYSNMIIYSFVAVLILLIAGLNFIILSIASNLRETKKIGILKLVGASSLNIYINIVGEALITGVLSLFFAGIIVEIFLGHITSMLGNYIETIYMRQIEFYLVFILITLFISIITGSFVALKFSGLQPLEIINKRFSQHKSKLKFRHSLLILQMVILISLITCSTIIQKQIRYFYNKDIGFNKEQLISIPIDKAMDAKTYNSFLSELRNVPGIVNAAGTRESLPTITTASSYIPFNDDPENGIIIMSLSVDNNFIETLELELIEGYTFSNELQSEVGAFNIIINETALKALRLGSDRTLRNGQLKIIGVVKDFNIQTLHSSIAPSMIYIGQQKYMREIVARLEPENIQSTIENIKNKWGEFVTNKEFSFEFFDDRLDDIYKEELNFAGLMRYFTILGIFISCLGLFGLVIFIAEQKTKEVGIRKVLGASRRKLWFDQIKEFALLTLVSGAIGIPVSYYLIQKWLDNFVYKAPLEWWIYGGVLILALLITILTISIKLIQVTNINPVYSLRDE